MKKIAVVLILSAVSFSEVRSQNFSVIDDPEIHDLIGKTVPGISSETFAGKKIDLKDYRGKVVLLNFWGLKCAVCYKEIIELNSLVEKYAGENFAVISVMEDSKEDVQKKIKSNGSYYSLIKPAMSNSNINFELIPGGESLKSTFGLDGVPMNFVIDANGIVQGFSSGYRASYDNSIPTANYKLLVQKIESVLNPSDLGEKK